MSGSKFTIEELVYLSVYHEKAAEYFATRAKDIEDGFQRDIDSGKRIDRGGVLFKGEIQVDILFTHRAYVIGAVFSSVAFMESFINEVFSECDEFRFRDDSKYKQQAINCYPAVWSSRKGSSRVLEKYQTALNVVRARPFEKGRLPYQDARLLISLRNRLVHYEPSWQLAETPDNNKELFRELKAKFKETFLARHILGKTAYFPHRCLGSGCAEWAIFSARSFIKSFADKIGLRMPSSIGAAKFDWGSVNRISCKERK